MYKESNIYDCYYSSFSADIYSAIWFHGNQQDDIESQGTSSNANFAPHFLHQWRFLTHLPYEKIFVKNE